MKKYVFATIAACALVTGIGGSSHATPLADSLISFTQYDNTNPSHFSTTTNTQASHTYASSADIQAFGDLTTGKVGTRSIGTEGSSTQNIVSMFDTLSFSETSNISYSYTYEGTLASSSTFEQPYSQGFVRIYDITGLDTWLESESVFGIFDWAMPVDAATEVSFAGDLLDSDNVPHDGTPVDVIETFTGSFLAEAAKTYGIYIASNSFTDGPGAVADFLGTGTFQFTDLGDTTFTSGSGAFLSQAASVPEPGTLALMGLGMVGLVAAARRRSTQL